MDGGGEGRRKLGRKPLTPMVALSDEEARYRSPSPHPSSYPEPERGP